MKHTLTYALARNRHGLSQVTLDMGIDPGTEMSPAALRFLAGAFLTIADEADSQPLGKGHGSKKASVDFEVELEPKATEREPISSSPKRSGMTIGGFGTSLPADNDEKP